MRHLRYVVFILAATSLCAAAAYACDANKTSAANASASKAGEHACCDGSAKSATAMRVHAGGSGVTGASTAAAAGKSACAMHGTAMAVGSKCELRGTANNEDCSVCADESQCDSDVRATGARAQVVPLRNGVMFVYSVSDPLNVRALQAAVARHNQRILAALSDTDADLCGDCKQFRGALASGKFAREVVNVQHGCQVLLTSTDHAIVQKIHDMTNAQMALRVKS